MSGALNLTVLAMIVKKKESYSYDDFRPISLCNTLYKVISKTIAERMNSILSRYISLEQSASLKDRSIHDVMGTTQEIIHSIRTRKIHVGVMKVDLSKAYDKVD